MGHRANYVFIRNGKATAYTDHWGALGCLFALEDGAAGMEKIAKFSERSSQLMDWGWAEGGYLVDHDEKRCITFGYVDIDVGELPAAMRGSTQAFIEAARSPAKLFEHVAKKWKGWTLEWNERGTDAFAAHLAKRGIGSIATHPPSAPANCGAAYVVTIGGEAPKKSAKTTSAKPKPRKKSARPKPRPTKRAKVKPKARAKKATAPARRK